MPDPSGKSYKYESYLADSTSRLRFDGKKYDNYALLSFNKAERGSPKLAREALKKEILTMSQMDVFEAVPFHQTSGETMVNSSVVMQVKSKNRIKARLVADGSETKRENFKETEVSGPTAKIESILTLLAISAGNNTIFTIADVNSAYLHVPMEEKVFMRLPVQATEEWLKLHPHDESQLHHGRLHVKLRKAIYGLRTSGLL
jgi:hypothetical protein